MNAHADKQKVRVGLLGVGLMGSAMGHRLIDQGIEVVAWNRSPEPVSALEERGAKRADDPAEVVLGTDVVITMLPTAGGDDLVADEQRPIKTAAAGDPESQQDDVAGHIRREHMPEAEIAGGVDDARGEGQHEQGPGQRVLQGGGAHLGELSGASQNRHPFVPRC